VSGLEGIGEAVTGGALASAIEPAAGSRSAGHGSHLPELRCRARGRILLAFFATQAATLFSLLLLALGVIG